ncbi:Triose-phosphate Transporter, partial [Podila epigama]
MTDTSQGGGHSPSSTHQEDAISTNPFADNLADSPHLQRVGGRGHNRSGSIASSHSSNDGIEWETPSTLSKSRNNTRYEDSFESDRDHPIMGGVSSYPQDLTDSDLDDDDSDYSSSIDEDHDHEDDEDYDGVGEGDEDTQRLLITSRNTRLGGMGMGLRAGETGTGTTIGLDLEQRFTTNNDRGDSYDSLPMTVVDHEGRSEGSTRHGRRKGSKRKGSKRRGGIDGRDRGRGHGDLGESTNTLHATQVDALAKRQLRIQMFWNIFYVFAWYSCSTSLSFYNKWLFSPQHYNFRFPLFTTCLHMVAQFLLSFLTLTLLPRFRPKAAPSAKDFGTKIMPCAVASGLDIGLSNSSLKTITLAFYTMCKSSSLAFVLLFAFLFRLERPTWMLVGVIAVICVGLFMMVMSEVDFVLIGFIQVMMASVLGGLRWSLTQLLLEKSDTKSGSLANPISTIFFLSPIMGVCLCIVAGIFEGYSTIFGSIFFESFTSTMSTLGLLFMGGVFAFSMVLAEFNLIARTSVVTLSVLGIVKEVITILISSLVFHDRLTLVNVLGLFVTLTGIGFYHFMKLREMKARAREVAKQVADLEHSKAAQRKERAMERKMARESKRTSSHQQYEQRQEEEQQGSSLSRQDDEPSKLPQQQQQHATSESDRSKSPFTTQQ